MSTPIITPETAEPTDPIVTETPAPEPVPESAHPDPITGEPGAHPVGVGVGALGAGAAGAAIGSIGGPVGILIGAAIGAVAGGLAGKEVASTEDALPVENEDSVTDEPASTVPTDMPMPISMGSIPGEGFRAMGGAGFGDASLFSTGAAAPVDGTGFQAPVVPEATPLAGSPMPRSGEEAIRVAAYYFYLGRIEGGQPGDALGDWLKAEREMMLG